MQNIDPIYFLQPITVILLVVALVIYWHYKQSFTLLVFLYSLAAYAAAIVIKIIFQEFTIGIVQSSNKLYILGLYYGLQTMILEVGLAYLVARYAISTRHLSAKDASGYGVGLAFWENGILLGIFPLLNLLLIYFLLASGGQASSLIYNELVSAQPGLFYPASQALPVVGLGILERISSIMLHISWGFLAFVAAFYKKNTYLLIALPMGMVDFFVPFSTAYGEAGLVAFEALFFIIALVSVLISLKVYMTLQQQQQQHRIEHSP